MITRKTDTIKSSRGRERLKRNGDKIVTRMLWICDQLYKQCTPDSPPQQLTAALQAYGELLPYAKPRLQAIDMQSVNINLSEDAATILKYQLEIHRLQQQLPETIVDVETKEIE